MSDAPRRRRDGTLEVAVRPRVDLEPRVREAVPDLCALEERKSAAHVVRDAGLTERFLDRLALRVGPVQHRELAEPSGTERKRFSRDPSRLGPRVLALNDDDRLVVVAVAEVVHGPPRGDQGLVTLLRVVPDHGAGRLEHARERSVVERQAHDPGAREIVAEPKDVPHGGAAPLVDRLVIVSDDHQAVDADRPALADQKPHEPHLRRVRVLELVDQQVLEREDREQDRVTLERRARVQNEVREVAGVAGDAGRPVQPVRLCGDRFQSERVGRSLDVGPDLGVVRLQPAVAPFVDRSHHGRRLDLVGLLLTALIVAVRRYQSVGEAVVENRLGLRGFEDREGRRRQHAPFLDRPERAAQQLDAERVERADVSEPFGIDAAPRGSADPDLGGRLPCESEREHRLGRDAVVLEQAGDSRRQRLRLTGAGRGEHEQRRPAMHRDLPLLLVQAVVGHSRPPLIKPELRHGLTPESSTGTQKVTRRAHVSYITWTRRSPDCMPATTRLARSAPLGSMRREARASGGF